jgi:hypothetical protein
LALQYRVPKTRAHIVRCWGRRHNGSRDWCELIAPPRTKSRGVGGADAVPDCATVAVVENEACAGREGDVAPVPKVGADGAGGLVVEGAVDCCVELRWELVGAYGVSLEWEVELERHVRREDRCQSHGTGRKGGRRVKPCGIKTTDLKL